MKTNSTNLFLITTPSSHKAKRNSRVDILLKFYDDILIEFRKTSTAAKTENGKKRENKIVKPQKSITTKTTTNVAIAKRRNKTTINRYRALQKTNSETFQHFNV